MSISSIAVPFLGTIRETRNLRRIILQKRQAELTFGGELNFPDNGIPLLHAALEEVNGVDPETVTIRVNDCKIVMTLTVAIPTFARGRLDPWVDTKVSQILWKIGEIKVAPVAMQQHSADKSSPTPPPAVKFTTHEAESAQPAQTTPAQQPAADDQPRFNPPGTSNKKTVARKEQRKRARQRANQGSHTG